LKPDDVLCVADVVMHHMTSKHGKNVSCSDFVRSACHDETFDLDLVTAVMKELKRPNQVSLVQRVLNSDVRKLKRSLDARNLEDVRRQCIPDAGEWRSISGFSFGSSRRTELSGSTTKTLGNDGGSSGSTSNLNKADNKNDCDASHTAPVGEPISPNTQAASDWGLQLRSSVGIDVGPMGTSHEQTQMGPKVASPRLDQDQKNAKEFSGSVGHEETQTSNRAPCPIQMPHGSRTLHASLARQELDEALETIKTEIGAIVEAEVQRRLTQLEVSLEQRFLHLECAFQNLVHHRPGSEESPPMVKGPDNDAGVPENRPSDSFDNSCAGITCLIQDTAAELSRPRPRSRSTPSCRAEAPEHGCSDKADHSFGGSVGQNHGTASNTSLRTFPSGPCSHLPALASDIDESWSGTTVDVDVYDMALQRAVTPTDVPSNEAARFSTRHARGVSEHRSSARRLQLERPLGRLIPNSTLRPASAEARYAIDAPVASEAVLAAVEDLRAEGKWSNV